MLATGELTEKNALLYLNRRIRIAGKVLTFRILRCSVGGMSDLQERLIRVFGLHPAQQQTAGLCDEPFGTMTHTM